MSPVVQRTRRGNGPAPRSSILAIMVVVLGGMCFIVAPPATGRGIIRGYHHALSSQPVMLSTPTERPGRGRRLLITAGPTHEPLDAVRYLANKSSGRLGVCLAEAGRDAGWEVTLLLGPTGLPPPEGVRTLRFVSTTDLAALLDEHFPACDVLIMAAAVADYRPRPAGVAKLPRTDDCLMIELEPTPDLVAACAARKRPGQRIIGFALEEPAALRARALHKLRAKGLDAIVANPLDTMGSPTITASVLTASGEVLTPPVPAVGPAGNTPTLPSASPSVTASTAGGLAKHAFAHWLIQWLAPAPPNRKPSP